MHDKDMQMHDKDVKKAFYQNCKIYLGQNNHTVSVLKNLYFFYLLHYMYLRKIKSIAMKSMKPYS